jgi:long-chain acyl-CoA synthetase
MTDTAAPDPLEMLTGPGGPFEIVTEEIRGVPTQVYSQRKFSLREYLEEAAGRGDAEALVQGDRRVSYGELGRICNSIMASLSEAGIGKGDRVAIISANSADWLLSFWSVVSMGAVVVPLNAWWKTDELEFVLDDCGAKAAIVDARRWDVIKDLPAKLPGLSHVWVSGDEDLAGPTPDALRAEAFAPLQTAHADAPMSSTPIDEDDDVAILYTSGTTGKPKGSVQTNRGAIANLQNLILRNVANLMASAQQPPEPAADGEDTPQALPIEQLCWLMVVPLFHVTGLFAAAMPALAAGGKIVFLPPQRFDPDLTMRLIQDEKVTHLTGVPTVVQRIISSPNFDDHELRTLMQVGYGGAPSTAELVRQVAAKMPWLTGGGATTAYGMTELAGVATANTGAAYRKYPTSCGQPLPTVEVKITDDDGNEVPVGERGEIRVKGPTVSPGYWNRPEANAESFIDGWFRTGDIGKVNDEGFVFILDRAKDMIIRGGENIYCAEVEDVIGRFPDVFDVAVLGVFHEDLGEEVKAVVVPREGRPLALEALKEFCAEHLAPYKVPTVWEVREEHLPRNPAGKILKQALRGEQTAFTDEDSDSVL